MSDPFAAALSAILASPMATDAVFTPSGGAPKAIRICRDGGTRPIDTPGGGLLFDTNLIQIRRADVDQVLGGDAISIGADNFTIQGGASLDVEGVTWSCGIIPTV